ncbi:AMP-binding protein [Streptomyces profundus]|uniref:AMP-binding protein n=1 Tax=Streptomyces profundus TaxID=2867410 RepID=UPI001D16F15A|nr:AMP-binding protein [Streptomyces sp. MA3_2.13]UED85818.1 AMP-binding protein [Streptomyces sp. MA3_2.13]
MSGDQHGGGRWSGPADVLTHGQLLRMGDQASAALLSHGVRAQDPVAVQLPMCLESVVITLACLKIGAQRLTLPLGDNRDFVRGRLNSSGARVVICADACDLDGRVHSVKANLDRTLARCPLVETVLVVRQLARPVPWEPGRDRWWHEDLAPRTLPPRPYPDRMSADIPPASGTSGTERLVFEDPLSSRSSDDGDHGWGEDPTQEASEGNLLRLINERPPHHI